MASIITGAVTVTSAGTAVQFSTTQDPIRSIRIRSTIGTCYIGASDVDATNAPSLALGKEVEFDWSNGRPGSLADLWVDADNANDAIRYWALPL